MQTESNQQRIDNLVNNSKAAMIAAIEIHNKPVFAYRYEVVTMLLINAWELIFKAYLLKNCPNIIVLRADNRTKEFEGCVECVKSDIGITFFVVAENVNKIYEYRCNCIHFYQENIDILLYSLSSKTVEFYSDFLKRYFGVDMAEENNLILLPIGFKKPISPIIYLSNKAHTENTSAAVTEFIKSIVTSTNTLLDHNIDDSILVGYKMSLTNENRISNADIKAAITQDRKESLIYPVTVFSENITITNEQTAKKIRVEEDSLFKNVYTEDYSTLIKECKARFSNFLQNPEFTDRIKNLKNNPTFHKERFLDVKRQAGVRKHYYTKAIYDELAKYYTKK